MTKMKQIVDDCIHGCTAHNLDECRMHFNVKYYVNDTHTHEGQRLYLFVYNIEELEDKLYNLVMEHLDKNSDVVIDCITVKNGEEIIKVNNKSYAYSLYELLKKSIG